MGKRWTTPAVLLGVMAALGAVAASPALAHGRHVYDLRITDAVDSTTRVPGGGAARGTYRTRVVVPVDRARGGGVEIRGSGRDDQIYKTTYRGHFHGHYDVGAGRCSYGVAGTVRGGVVWRPSHGLRIAPTVRRFPGRRGPDACVNPRTDDPYVFFTIEAGGFRFCLDKAARKAALGIRRYRCSYTFEGVRFRRLGRGTARVSEKRSGTIELRRAGRGGR